MTESETTSGRPCPSTIISYAGLLNPKSPGATSTNYAYAGESASFSIRGARETLTFLNLNLMLYMKVLLLLITLLFSSERIYAGGRPDPQVQIDAFFKILDEKGGIAAIKELCEGTLFGNQKGVELETYASQLDTAAKLYGKLIRVESVDKKLFGESFARHRLISYHASGAPLFWEFMFARAKAEWEICVVRFNDQFYRVFSDVP
jgi:hypothetical protein